MFRRLFAVVVMLGVLSVSTPAKAVVYGDWISDADVRAEGLKPENRSVGTLAYLSTDGQVYSWASCIYLGDGGFVTAAHAVLGMESRPDYVHAVLDFGPNFMTDWNPEVSVSEMVVHPNYNASLGWGMSTDLAYGYAEVPQGVPAAKLPDRAISVGDFGELIGYGFYGNNASGGVNYSGDIRAVTNIVSGRGGDGSLEYDPYDPNFAFLRLDRKTFNPTLLEGVACGDDSGGEFRIGDTAAGLIVMGTGPGTPGMFYDFSTGVLDLYSQKDWIIEQQQAHVPEPGSMALLAMAFGGVLFRILRRENKWLVCVVLVGLLFTSGPAFAGMLPSPDALEQSRQFAITSPESEATGWFRASGTSDGSDYWWSGTLIDPWHVLTVGHGPAGTVGYTGLQFGLSPNMNNPDLATTRTVVKTTLYSDYPGGGAWGGSYNDIAVCKLDTPIYGVNYATWESDPANDANLLGSTLDMFGMGMPGTYSDGLLTSTGDEHGGQNVVKRFGWSGLGISSNYALWDFGPAWSTPTLALEYQGTPGDSGGGVFYNNKLVAMLDFQLGNYAYTGALLVAPYDSFIRGATADVPEPGTLMLLASALGGGGPFAFVFVRRRKNQIK